MKKFKIERILGIVNLLSEFSFDCSIILLYDINSFLIKFKNIYLIISLIFIISCSGKQIVMNTSRRVSLLTIGKDTKKSVISLLGTVF